MTSENDAALAAYASALEHTTLAAETRRTYRSRVRVYLAWLCTPEALHDVAARDRAVADYRTHLAALGRSPRYVNNAMAALDDFYQRRNLGRIAAGREAVPRPSPRAQSSAARERLIERVSQWPHTRDRLIALLAAHAGLRVGEIVALDVADVADATDVADVADLADTRRTGDARLRPAADAWLAERAGWPGAAGDALFLNRRGGRLSVRSAGAVLASIGQVGGAAGRAMSPGDPTEVRRGALRGGQRERRERVID